jgi:hypothetical protein
MRGPIRSLLLCCVVMFASRAHANGVSINFPSGSLIIPTTSAYQDDCGAVSAYGLIYDVLRANAWLASNGYTAITINYAISDTKASPNRCKPTNLTGAPKTNTSGTYPSCNALCQVDASWNDGCDFSITNAIGTPVKLINNANHSAADTTITTIDTTGNGTVSPGYTATTIGLGVTTVNYLGGPFVISSAPHGAKPSDATVLTKLLDNTISAKDSQNNTIDFGPFRSATACGGLGTANHVNIHRSTAAFTATIDKQFQIAPPRLALLATDVSGSTSGGCGVGAGLEYDGSSSTGTHRVCDGILESYLVNAGLGFGGAQGCPVGGVNAGNAALCPGGGVSGQIFDVFDFADIVAGRLAAVSGGKPVYGMLWTPHWESHGTGSLVANETTAFTKIAAFLDGPNGLAAECASISTYEGSYNGGSPDLKDGLQLQTCTNSGGVCSAGTYGVDRSTSGVPSGTLPNCSDIEMTNGKKCVYYSYPSDPFVQIGDFSWNAVSGHTQNYLVPLAATSSMYRPGVTPLVSAVNSLDRAKLTDATTARAMIVSDLSTKNFKDNNTAKSQVLYLAGHDQTDEVAGNKVMLETLLQLGFTPPPPPPAPIELSRATPIVAQINGNDAIVQGTFEYFSPPATKTTVTLAADVPGFTFPYLNGHMRARTATSVTTAASSFLSGTILFDAAAFIPAVSFSGCGGPPFNGTCRNVFTTTTASGTGVTQNPPIVLVQDGNGDAIGSLIAPGLTHPDWVTMTERVLAGIPAGPGVFVPQLGGVDRSTVAVIGTSQFTNATRATMIYFGATDGMLHAVCGSVDAAHGCDVLGRELWAFIPRVQLPFVRLNTTRIDGSPHVADLFGDWAGTGTKTFRTILTFQTGSGDVTTTRQTPAVYAMDITDPQNPKVVWEYTLVGSSGATTRGAFELGTGETLAVGVAQINGGPTGMVYAETNNGGTGGAGVVLSAINAVTGARQFQVGYAYPAPRLGGDSAVPATGIPGGAVGVDKAGQGFVTDVVFADLYGNLWEVDPSSGASRTGVTTPLTTPLFSFSTDYHPIGAVPAIYSNASTLFAVLVTGGYADLADTTWGSATGYVVSVRLTPQGGTPPFNEGSGPPNVPFAFTFGSGERGFSQATIVGTQLFVTTDSTDVNATGYGAPGGNTGHVYSYNTATSTQGTTVVVASGATSVANDGTNLYTSSGAQQQQVSSGAASTTGPKADNQSTFQMLRRLWLRTQ